MKKIAVALASAIITITALSGCGSTKTLEATPLAPAPIAVQPVANITLKCWDRTAPRKEVQEVNQLTVEMFRGLVTEPALRIKAVQELRDIKAALRTGEVPDAWMKRNPCQTIDKLRWTATNLEKVLNEK